LTLSSVFGKALFEADPAFHNSTTNYFFDVDSQQNTDKTYESPSQEVLKLCIGNPISEEHKTIADHQEHDFLEHLCLVLGFGKERFDKAVVGDNQYLLFEEHHELHSWLIRIEEARADKSEPSPQENQRLETLPYGVGFDSLDRSPVPFFENHIAKLVLVPR
jgi:hypothetical protein